MARMSAKKRKSLPSSSFALPKQRKYLLTDKTHARLALAMVSKHGTPAQKKTVRSKVKRKFPSIGKKG